MHIRVLSAVGSLVAAFAVAGAAPATASDAKAGGDLADKLAAFTAEQPRTAAPDGARRSFIRSLGAHSGEGLADVTAMSEPGCTDNFQTDPADSSALDISATMLRYCADAPPIFILGVQSYDGWVRDQLDGLIIQMDTDLNAGTGCDGGEFVAFGSFDYTDGLTADVIATPTCDTGSWVHRGSAFIDRADSIDFIGMGWEAAQIDSPRTVRYGVGMGDGFAFDRAPDTGNYTLTLDSAPPPPPPPPPAKTYPTPVGRDITDTCDGRQGAAFTDTPGTTHAYSIDCVSGRQITSGRTATTYEPDETLTQGQTATFLVKTLQAAGVNLPEPEVICTESDVHADNMERLMSAGVVPRAGDGVCGPTVSISRERMALWTRNALAEGGVLGDASVDWYSDDDASPYTWQINEITSLGIVTGKGGALYGPGESLTRGQMATFLARSLDALGT